MFNEHTIVGYVLAALVLIIGFVATVLKLTRPIQDLNTNIVKLTTIMSFLVKEQDNLKERVTEHGKEIDVITNKLITITTKIENFEKFENEVRTHEHHKT